MGLPTRSADAVDRHRQAASLQPFLELRLRVFAPVADLGGGDDLAEHALHERTGRIEAAVEKGGADDGLERIGQDGDPLGAAAARLAFGQAQDLRQAQRQRDLVQAVLAYQVSPDAREVAFVAKRSNSRLEMAKLSTASPRNSSRSLWSAPKLRCLRARSSNPSSAKRWPRRCCSAASRGSMVYSSEDDYFCLELP
jgi:hypothetical protein